jgi:hypothetical protein
MGKLPILSARMMRLLKIAVSSFIIIESLVLAFLMRPIQDDYFNLESVQQMGILGYLNDTWNNHGGNMVQFFIHCIVILPTTQSFVFWNLGLFFITTEFLVFLTVKTLLGWLFKSISISMRFWVSLLSVVGFEGLFVPGFLGAYGFSLASLAHLWPVMAFIVGLVGSKRFRGSWVFALLLGLIAGNSNLGESAFACGAWLLVLLAFHWIKNFEKESGLKRDLDFYLLGFGSLLGTVGIAAAPGFWNRASDQVGLPHSLGDFVKRFAKSFASFTADGLSHPMVWVLVLLGIVVALILPKADLVLDNFRFKMLAIGTCLIWIALILGSTFAYPAWHQSMGMYVLLLPFSFCLGNAGIINLNLKLSILALVFAGIVMTATFLRIGVLGVNRTLVWDRNLHTNICLLETNHDAKLLGAEIQYPPFGLGVDDVNTWDWMRNKYVGWVDAVPHKTICD